MASAPAEHRASLGVFSRQFKTCLGYAYEKRLEDQQRHPGFKSAYVSDWHFDNLGRDIWAHEKALFSAAHTANPMAMQIIQQLLQFAACELNPSLTERAEDKVELAGRQEAMRLRLEATCKAAALTRA